MIKSLDFNVETRKAFLIAEMERHRLEWQRCKDELSELDDPFWATARNSGGEGTGRKGRNARAAMPDHPHLDEESMP